MQRSTPGIENATCVVADWFVEVRTGRNCVELS